MVSKVHNFYYLLPHQSFVYQCYLNITSVIFVLRKSLYANSPNNNMQFSHIILPIFSNKCIIMILMENKDLRKICVFYHNYPCN